MMKKWVVVVTVVAVLMASIVSGTTPPDDDRDDKMSRKLPSPKLDDDEVKGSFDDMDLSNDNDDDGNDNDENDDGNDNDDNDNDNDNDDDDDAINGVDRDTIVNELMDEFGIENDDGANVASSNSENFSFDGDGVFDHYGQDDGKEEERRLRGGSSNRDKRHGSGRSSLNNSDATKKLDSDDYDVGADIDRAFQESEGLDANDQHQPPVNPMPPQPMPSNHPQSNQPQPHQIQPQQQPILPQPVPDNQFFDAMANYYNLRNQGGRGSHQPHGHRQLIVPPLPQHLQFPPLFIPAGAHAGPNFDGLQWPGAGGWMNEMGNHRQANQQGRGTGRGRGRGFYSNVNRHSRNNNGLPGWIVEDGDDLPFPGINQGNQNRGNQGQQRQQQPPQQMQQGQPQQIQQPQQQGQPQQMHQPQQQGQPQQIQQPRQQRPPRNPPAFQDAALLEFFRSNPEMMNDPEMKHLVPAELREFREEDENAGGNRPNNALNQNSSNDQNSNNDQNNNNGRQVNIIDNYDPTNDSDGDDDDNEEKSADQPTDERPSGQPANSPSNDAPQQPDQPPLYPQPAQPNENQQNDQQPVQPNDNQQNDQQPQPDPQVMQIMEMLGGARQGGQNNAPHAHYYCQNCGRYHSLPGLGGGLVFLNGGNRGGGRGRGGANGNRNNNNQDGDDGAANVDDYPAPNGQPNIEQMTDEELTAWLARNENVLEQPQMVGYNGQPLQRVDNQPDGQQPAQPVQGNRGGLVEQLQQDRQEVELVPMEDRLQTAEARHGLLQEMDEDDLYLERMASDGQGNAEDDQPGGGQLDATVIQGVVNSDDGTKGERAKTKKDKKEKKDTKKDKRDKKEKKTEKEKEEKEAEDRNVEMGELKDSDKEKEKNDARSSDDGEMKNEEPKTPEDDESSDEDNGKKYVFSIGKSDSDEDEDDAEYMPDLQPDPDLHGIRRGPQRNHNPEPLRQHVPQGQRHHQPPRYLPNNGARNNGPLQLGQPFFNPLFANFRPNPMSAVAAINDIADRNHIASIVYDSGYRKDAVLTALNRFWNLNDAIGFAEIINMCDKTNVPPIKDLVPFIVTFMLEEPDSPQTVDFVRHLVTAGQGSHEFIIALSGEGILPPLAVLKALREICQRTCTSAVISDWAEKQNQKGTGELKEEEWLERIGYLADWLSVAAEMELDPLDINSLMPGEGRQWAPIIGRASEGGLVFLSLEPQSDSSSVSLTGNSIVIDGCELGLSAGGQLSISFLDSFDPTMESLLAGSVIATTTASTSSTADQDDPNKKPPIFVIGVVKVDPETSNSAEIYPIHLNTPSFSLPCVKEGSIVLFARGRDWGKPDMLTLLGAFMFSTLQTFQGELRGFVRNLGRVGASVIAAPIY